MEMLIHASRARWMIGWDNSTLGSGGRYRNLDNSLYVHCGAKQRNFRQLSRKKTRTVMGQLTSHFLYKYVRTIGALKCSVHWPHPWITIIIINSCLDKMFQDHGNCGIFFWNGTKIYLQKSIFGCLSYYLFYQKFRETTKIMIKFDFLIFKVSLGAWPS